MRIFKATLQTRNFTFEAYGEDEVDAQMNLEAGLERHAKQYRLATNWHMGMDVEYQEIKVGQCYRDRQEIA